MLMHQKLAYCKLLPSAGVAQRKSLNMRAERRCTFQPCHSGSCQHGNDAESLPVFAWQALNMQNAGAAAVLVYDDQINDYFVAASNDTASGITLPAMSLPRRLGQLLVSATTVRHMTGM